MREIEEGEDMNLLCLAAFRDPVTHLNHILHLLVVCYSWLIVGQVFRSQRALIFVSQFLSLLGCINGGVTPSASGRVVSFQRSPSSLPSGALAVTTAVPVPAVAATQAASIMILAALAMPHARGRSGTRGVPCVRRAASAPFASGWRGHAAGDGTRPASASSGST